MRYSLLYITLTVVVGSCSQHQGKAVMTKIKENTEKITYDLSDFPAYIKEMEIATALTDIAEKDSQFLIPARTMKISSFPCSNCHNKPLEQLKAEQPGKKAHWDIALSHAKTHTMNCFSCHNMDKPDELTSLTGNSIGFDHSYQLCAQCHSTPYKDWQGGTHGKRLQGWVPPRVSQTCTGCHNPHKPAFEKRWPSRLNTAK